MHKRATLGGRLKIPLDRRAVSESNSPTSSAGRWFAIHSVKQGCESVVEPLLRLGNYVWPQRKALAASLLAALAVAALWTAALTLAFPIVKVLLEGRSLHQYVTAEIAEAESKSAELALQLAELDRALEANRPAPSERISSEYARQVREQASCRAKLSTVTTQHSRLIWVNRRIIPWLPFDPFAEFTIILLLLAAMTAVKGVCEYFQETCIGGVVERILMQVRERLLRSTLRLDCQTLALEGTPQLMSRFTFDLTQLSHGLNLLGSQVMVEPLKAAVCIIGAFTVNWRLTLLSILCVPPAALVLGAIGKHLKKSSRKQMETMGEVYQVLEETLSSFRIVQAFGNERLHRRRFHAASKAYFRRAYQILRLDAINNPAMETLATFAGFLALAPGAYLVLRGKTSIWGIQLSATPLEVADLALLYTLLAGVLDPVRKLSNVYSKVKKASAAAARLFELLDRESLVLDASRPAELPRHSRSIEFEHIRFRYAVAGVEHTPRPPAIDDVSWRIPFGSVVAVLGENGSGKSTLVQLLLRFFDPQEGRVRIDGVDLRSVSLRALRAQIGYVSQETQLFDGTIAENIRYGQPSATNDEIEAAARLAYVSAFSDHLPLKLQTPVGEKGCRLSGGQRQRVSLARAMLRNPAIMILDEATSAIDAQSEQLILQSLRSVSQGRTAFVITHRMTPELLEFVTLVAVFERGKLIGVGPHDLLLRTCPTYQRLSQTARFQRNAA